jgi:FkbM family methyltransferase
MTAPLDQLITLLPSLTAFHAPASPLYAFLANIAHAEVTLRFGPDSRAPQGLEPFGSLVFPYQRMGAIDSTDLFGLDELILFALYWANRSRYHRVLDIGANLGLHSIVLERCGFEVRSFEPDPQHFRLLAENLHVNGSSRVQAVNAAVSSEDGRVEFVRVLGNTTSSHLAGSKAHPYGDLERFPVDVAAIAPLMSWADFVKLDVEGHERQIVCATTTADWTSTDMVLEIGSPENAEAVYRHCGQLGLRLFAQKLGWKAVSSLEDMPKTYRDGSLFISAHTWGPWPAMAADPTVPAGAGRMS